MRAGTALQKLRRRTLARPSRQRAADRGGAQGAGRAQEERIG